MIRKFVSWAYFINIQSYSTLWPMLCFQLKINRVFCSMSSYESSWRQACAARDRSGSFWIILEGGPSREMRNAACPRARFDLSNKNNIQLKGNNTLGLIFIVTILHIEPFGQFSVCKFLSYSFLYNSELILYRMWVCSSVLVPRHAAAAAVDDAATLMPHIASFISYSLCNTELVYCLLQHTTLYIMTKSQYNSLQIIEFVYL